MPLLDHFDMIAPFYDRAISRYSSDKLLELMALPASGRLLDAAGGTGRVSQALRPYIDQVVVVDLSMGMLRQAKAKNGLNLACAHTERLPFPEASFERIVMVDALHHVCNQAATASELWRVLKPGGRIVIEEPDFDRWLIKLIALAEKALLMRSHFLAPKAIASLFSRFSAQVEMIRDELTVWVIVEKPN